MSSSHVWKVWLIALGFLQGGAAWCQASPGSCVGELRSLEKYRSIYHDDDFGNSLEIIAGSIGPDHLRVANTSKDLLRFVDWDGDGDVDILLGTYQQNSFRILFHERISEDSFLTHELVTLTGLHRKRAISKDWYFFHPEEIENSVFHVVLAEAYRSNSSTVEGFQVADWDGDGRLDLLLCMQGPAVSNITFLNRALLPVNSIENGTLILSASSVRQDTLCDMQPVDFDEDGVVDLFLGGFTRYFNRQSTDSDLIEQTNPLGIYNGSVLQVFDFDADGQLELLLDAFGPNDHIHMVTFRWLRRALDGSFVESEENPFAFVQVYNQGRSIHKIQGMYLTDWNADGLPDVVVVQIWEDTDGSSHLSVGPDWYQQVRNLDLMYNSHLTAFEEIPVSFADEISVLDWNQDGFDDHVDIDSQNQLYEISDVAAKPVLEKPHTFVAWKKGGALRFELRLAFSYVDWDGDGDLDLLVENINRSQLEYWEQVDGQFRLAEDLDIRFSGLWFRGPVEEIWTVDWDQDGDVDLVLVENGETQERYFERLPNGSLCEKPQHPFKGIFTRNKTWQSLRSGHFLDCDGDGDLDMLRWTPFDPQPVQACEHDKDAGTLTCSHEFLCLGTNVSNFRFGRGTAFARFGTLESFDLVNISDGRLKFAAIHWNKPSPVLWTAGFCVPRSPCHGKGFCNENHQHCQCLKGYELKDCSQCGRNYHGVFQHVWQMRECKSCPQSDGHLCHGRGECFDDAQAPRDSTQLLVAGNGSCRCHEAYFNGTDTEGRKTCSEGSCPAGSEETGGRCHPCDGGEFSAAGSSCTPCRPGSYSSSAGSSSCQVCPPGLMAPKAGLTACEPCSAGFYSGQGFSSCSPCPSGSVSDPGSSSCRQCNDDRNFFRGVSDELNQNCQVDSVEILLMALSTVAATCFCLSCLTGLHGRIAIADLSTQGEKLVMTTNLSHFLLKHAPNVTFKGTENPSLDNLRWTVHKLSSFQLTLLGVSQLNQVDTSMGHLIFQFPWAFIHTGVLRCPLILWCSFFGAASAAAMIRLTGSAILVVIVVGICAGFLAFAWRCRLSHRTPISKRRRQFLKEWPLPRQPCERGPDRSMTAGQLQDFLQFFDAFIKERSMYYVCSDIVKPLTKPFRLSFVELIGPSTMEWFVSHCWGMTVRHFNDAIRRHAMSYASDWRGVTYWICTFSNNQWRVSDELGNGAWQESSFYLALSSPSCRGTAMVIDEQVLPLQRIWCLFEVYHTILLSQNDEFEGLLLCTSTGVLQEGRAGTDVAVRVAERVRQLDTRSAEASHQADLRMIHELIERMPGGFDAMNGFVRETICRALARSHEQYELTFQGLICDLASEGVSARAEANAAEEPLPTLLLRRNADFASPKGQESPRDCFFV